MVFSGGKTVVISNSGMNSALDTEKGYTYTAGEVLAIMPRGGMTSESTHCQNFSSIGKSMQSSLASGDYLTVGIGSSKVTLKMPASFSAQIVVLGDTFPSVTTSSDCAQTLDENGVCWH